MLQFLKVLVRHAKVEDRLESSVNPNKIRGVIIPGMDDSFANEIQKRLLNTFVTSYLVTSCITCVLQLHLPPYSPQLPFLSFLLSCDSGSDWLIECTY